MAVFFVLSTALACSSGPPQAPPDPTFARDIAPIVYTNCATCHRPGQAAPFSLLTYADVKSRARQIAEVTTSRYMPPWKPEPGHGAFVGERRLTAAQISTIARWVERGAPEGDLRDLPRSPSWPDGWQLGAPDITIAMPMPVDVAAHGVDIFRTVIIPFPTEGVRYVRAVEFRPGTARAVHHAVVKLGASLRTEARSPKSEARIIASEGMLGTEEDIGSPNGHLVGWAPGYSPYVAPAGMAWRLDPGAAVAIEMHLQPTGKPEQVQASVGLFLTDEPPTRTPFGLQLGAYTIDIPAGARDYSIEDRYELPVDVELLAVYPHAHYLGKDLRAYATLPDGTEHSLIWIKDWDFAWQNAYQYREPLRLPRGTIVRMRYTYDNSAQNPRNPSSPPRRVRYGGQSTDEMGNLWMQVAPVAPADLIALRDDYALKSAQRRIEGYERLAADRPGHAGLRRALGSTYLVAGRIDDALRTLQEAVRLEPRDATGHYNLAHALAASGRAADAVVHFRNAARLLPSFAEAHNNLGALLRESGQLAEAERAFRSAIAAAPTYAPAHNNLATVRRARGDARGAIAVLREAVRLDPAYGDAHFNLGLAYHDAGDPAAATRHLRRAIELMPNAAHPYSALAWLLLTAADATPSSLAEAVSLGQRAATLSQGNDASILDTLAAAYARTGDLDRARVTAERGVRVATAAGQKELAAAISKRLVKYGVRSGSE